MYFLVCQSSNSWGMTALMIQIPLSIEVGLNNDFSIKAEIIAIRHEMATKEDIAKSISH
ncbi:MAG: hypothetical protein HQK97_06005 [Nitrospirae bacterium]|nr:hypothetical protein [Nitrospirota bacterium]